MDQISCENATKINSRDDNESDDDEMMMKFNQYNIKESEKNQNFEFIEE